MSTSAVAKVEETVSWSVVSSPRGHRDGAQLADEEHERQQVALRPDAGPVGRHLDAGR